MPEVKDHKAKEAVHPHGEHICVCSKCEHEITVEENIKCNTQECPECGAPMIAKTAGERRESMSMSDKNKSTLLQAALVTEYKIGQSTPIPKSLTIVEVFGDKVIYDIDGQLYESSYELDEDGKATLGEPKKVLSTKIYKAMESASFENTRTILDAALISHLNLGKEEYAYIEDINENDFVYRRGNQSYQ